MNDAHAYPRVLLVSRAEISDADSSGISRGRWFADWPKDRIAQIYSSPGSWKEPFSPIRYEFGGKDRQLGKVFARVKGSSFSVAYLHQTVRVASESRLKKRVQRLKCAMVSSLVSTGLWELLFWPKPSESLLQWCQAFKPDLIFTSCTDLSYMQLTLALQSQLNVPVCLQVEDDWLGSLYTKGLCAPFLRPLVNRKIGQLLNAASTCLSLGPLMTAEYKRRYNKKFETVYLADDIQRFDQAVPKRLAARKFVVVYSGSLYLGRWRGLLDLDAALSLLETDAEIHVFTGHIPPEAAAAFSSSSRIRVYPGLKDAEVPAVFKGADLLFLPESFEPQYQKYIRFSISSKAHLYMMAGRPALVYGPNSMSVVEYARTGWAVLVDQPNVASLSSAVRAIMKGGSSIDAILKNARETALAHHEGRCVREQFRNLLFDCANSKNPELALPLAAAR